MLPESSSWLIFILGVLRIFGLLEILSIEFWANFRFCHLLSHFLFNQRFINWYILYSMSDMVRVKLCHLTQIKTNLIILCHLASVFKLQFSCLYGIVNHFVTSLMYRYLILSLKQTIMWNGKLKYWATYCPESRLLKESLRISDKITWRLDFIQVKRRSSPWFRLWNFTYWFFNWATKELVPFLVDGRRGPASWQQPLQSILVFLEMY